MILRWLIFLTVCVFPFEPYFFFKKKKKENRCSSESSWKPPVIKVCHWPTAIHWCPTVGFNFVKTLNPYPKPQAFSSDNLSNSYSTLLNCLLTIRWCFLLKSTIIKPPLTALKRFVLEVFMKIPFCIAVLKWHVSYLQVIFLVEIWLITSKQLQLANLSDVNSSFIANSHQRILREGTIWV